MVVLLTGDEGRGAKKRYRAEEIEEANLARRERKTRKEREERRQGVKAETHARIQKEIRTYLEANGGKRSRPGS